MPRALLWGACVAAVILAVVWQVQTRMREPAVLFDPPVRPIESAPLCPWREPEMDLPTFFPEGASYITETRVLSGLRVELTKSLGRAPEPEENALTLHRIFAGSEKIGFVLTRRVKGEHGAIELVLALNPSGEVLGVRLQRLREPDPIASQVQQAAWLARFRGRTHDRGWDSDDVSALAEEARPSARAIREGVRSLLVLHAPTEGVYSVSDHPHRH
jgi:hypothetical protein